jgi:cytoskeletal protein CcmA (bactofilin family)
MFSSRNKDNVPATQPSVTVPAAARRGRGASAPSIISGDMAIQGSLSSSGDIQIDGRIEGDIRSAGLVIGENAEVQGEIHAEDVTVRGKVMGRIRARKILLAATSRVEGDILHEAFAVESGAFFEGNCRHSDNPLGDTAPGKEEHAPDPSVQKPDHAGMAPDSVGLFAPVSRVAT